MVALSILYVVAAAFMLLGLGVFIAIIWTLAKRRDIRYKEKYEAFLKQKKAVDAKLRNGVKHSP